MKGRPRPRLIPISSSGAPTFAPAVVALSVWLLFGGNARAQTTPPAIPPPRIPATESRESRLSELLDDSADDDSTYFPEARNDSRQPDIRKPGPDSANFPNSPYTLRQGRLYIETSPVFLTGPEDDGPAQYNFEYLIRYGLTDRVEFRIFSSGLTTNLARQTTSGMSPIAFDFKTNFWKENRRYAIPAVGFEAFLITQTGSPGFNTGTQPGFSLLFDHTLPGEFLLEWNIGAQGDPESSNTNQLQFALQWALQHELVEGFDVFTHGYVNGSSVPRLGDGIVVGGGFVWAVNTRIALFGSYNAGLTPAAPTTVFQLGGAIAF